MAILEPNIENITKAINLLKNGELVAFPTETVYGLGADGFNKNAVAKIFEAKKRPTFNPLILHVSSLKMLNTVANYKSEKIQLLVDNFWPGPLTLILKRKKTVPYIVTSGLETVAVRMPKNDIALDLIKKLGRPIAAPSANSFSKLSPTTAQHVHKQLGDKVNIILEGGKCDVGVESTIIEVNEDTQTLLRPGGIPKEDIEKVIGKLSEPKKDKVTPNSPGQLAVHYAPNLPIKFYSEDKIASLSGLKLGGIFFSDGKNLDKFTVSKILSHSGNFNEAASNLFSYLHELETMDLDLILVEPVEKTGLGIAIMDRLTKAVNKYL